MSNSEGQRDDSNPNTGEEFDREATRPPESARRRAWRRAREREREARRILAEYFPESADLDLPCEVLSFTRERIVFELGGSTYDIRRPTSDSSAPG